MHPRAVVLQHVPFEGPARVADAFARAGAAVEVARLWEGAPVPDQLAPGEPLVVLGGPMGVGDLGDSRWPFLRREIALVERRLRGGEPILGICLGAQLLAHAAGARVYPNVREEPGGPRRLVREVGWGEVRFFRAAHPALAAVGERELVFHWHGDTFELPAGSSWLAASDACAHQAFAIGERCFGLQFHCEASPESIEALLSADGAYAREALGEGAVERIRADTIRNGDRLREIGDRLLDALVEAMLARPARTAVDTRCHDE